MKNIGKYNGILCYTCTNTEWKSYYDKGKDDGKQIFIIDGIMVRNNKIIGHYDGQHVKDRYDEQPYFVATATKDNHDVMNLPKQHKKAPVAADNEAVSTPGQTMSYEEVVAQEIRFSDYTKIVDEFFALLEV